MHKYCNDFCKKNKVNKCEDCEYIKPKVQDENYTFCNLWNYIKTVRNCNGNVDFNAIDFICRTLNYKLSEEDLRKINLLEAILSDYKNKKNKDENYSYFLKPIETQEELEKKKTRIKPNGK